MDGCGGGGVEPGEEVGVEVAEEQGGLEEDQAGEPDGGGASERGEELLGGDGLNEEQEQGGEKDGCGGQGVLRHCDLLPSARFGSARFGVWVPPVVFGQSPDFIVFRLGIIL